MRISGVSTVVVDAGDRDWVFVRVATDEPGLVGWGESSLGWHTRAVCGAVQDLEPLLVGQDPRPVERLWQRMVRGPYFRGGIVTMSAVAGIDQALWDIKAKDLGVPLFELLGGPVRDSGPNVRQPRIRAWRRCAGSGGMGGRRRGGPQGRFRCDEGVPDGTGARVGGRGRGRRSR